MSKKRVYISIHPGGKNKAQFSYYKCLHAMSQKSHSLPIESLKVGLLPAFQIHLVFTHDILGIKGFHNPYPIVPFYKAQQKNSNSRPSDNKLFEGRVEKELLGNFPFKCPFLEKQEDVILYLKISFISKNIFQQSNWKVY